MSSLFSMFDPKAAFGLSLNWCASFLCLWLFPIRVWSTPNQVSVLAKGLTQYIFVEFKSLMGPLMQPGSLLVSISLFVYILMVNFLGLLPFCFPSSSHLVFSVSLALPLWLGHMITSWWKQPNAMFAHLVPVGTPNLLLPFMVLIEVVSSLIRPITLSVRLAANIIAGHLLLTLLSNSGEAAAAPIMALIISALVALSLLESAVAIIQAYVFSILSTMYISEVQGKSIF